MLARHPCSILFACVLTVLAAAADGTELPAERAAALGQLHEALAPALAESALGLPLLVRSDLGDNTASGEVFGELAFPFADVRAALIDPPAWCEIAPLHLNVKGCTYESRPDGTRVIAFYSGRKFYEPPEDTYRLAYAFRVAADYLRVALTAAEGPLSTHD